jgi:hypothetical protein
MGSTAERPGAHDLSPDAIQQVMAVGADKPPLEESPGGHALGEALAELDRLSADLLRLEERAQRIRVLLRNLTA